MTTEMWGDIADLVRWLDHVNGRGDLEMTMRLLKIVGEAGEVADAWSGALGQNPRKGVTHTRDDVAAELCDVIVTAMVALRTLTGADARLHLEEKIAGCLKRAALTPVPTINSNGDRHDPDTCTSRREGPHRGRRQAKHG
jgi:NTP pyrophosphatase (non-canonical NTP hydrolase)